MTATTFNTLKLSERLHEAGMPEVQAKAASHALHETLAEFATKRDLREVFDELRADFRFGTQSFHSDPKAELRLLRVELGADMQSLRAETRLLRSDLSAEIQLLRGEMKLFRTEVSADTSTPCAPICANSNPG